MTIQNNHKDKNTDQYNRIKNPELDLSPTPNIFDFQQNTKAVQ